jgi:hypothetical protein
MAIYQSLDLPLLLEDSWVKRPEDPVERTRIMEALKGANPELDLATWPLFWTGFDFGPKKWQQAL